MHQSIGQKILDFDSLFERVGQWRISHKRVVFTNGVFDLLHPGHADYLARAAECGDKLVVGINSDASVQGLQKGPERPIVPCEARMALVAALASVDAVCAFDEDTPIRLIEALRPDILVKGGDYDPECTDPSSPRYLVGSDVVRNNGGDVLTIPLLEGYSSTGIIRKIQQHG